MEEEGSSATDAPRPEPAPDPRLQLASRFQSGANWFYWIAGLSLINSAIQLMGSETSFIIGLGITQLGDAIAKEIQKESGEAGNIILAVAFVFDLLVAGVFVAFGVLARKKRTWAFVVGMILYAADGLIFLMVKQWLSLGFHAFALYCIYVGFRACRELIQLEQAEARVQAAGAASLG